MTIGIIIGSIREGRSGEAIGTWVAKQAAGREQAYELVDLKEYNVPLLSSPVVPGQANGNYDDENVQAWADKIGSLDGFIFVTPEYNHSVPGPFKNAFDSILEWKGKPVGFVAYGFGGGKDAVAAWIPAVDSMLAMPYGKKSTHINIPEFFGEEGFAPTDELNAELATTLDELEGLVA